MKDFKNKKKHVIAQRNNSKQLPPPLRGRKEFLCERSELRNSGGGFNLSSTKAAFTLAEVLITLAVIGIVAVLTIPSMVKSHNERAWSTAKDVFSKRLDVAMKSMNTDGTLTGYETTEDFVNALKKNIKINQVCTDDVTKCFVKKIQWRKYGDNIVEITNDNITFNTDAGQDWAETVGVRFANGVNALIAYNKNCSDDPYNNQYSPSANCIGIIYDVQANKQPNTYGKDIDINKNVSKIAGKGLCEYEMTDGTCFSKILTPGKDYSPMTQAECAEKKEKNEIDVDYCYAKEEPGDYYAGAVLACGGKKDNLPTQAQLTKLAKEVYNTENINGNRNEFTSGNIDLDTEKAAPFIAQYPGSSVFDIWSNQEYSTCDADHRFFHTNATNYGNNRRNYHFILAVCVE